MDKDTIIALTLGKGSGLELICDYCKEMGKDEIKISQFVTTLTMNPFMQGVYLWCYNYALEYYQRKFNICILRHEDGRIIDAY